MPDLSGDRIVVHKWILIVTGLVVMIGSGGCREDTEAGDGDAKSPVTIEEVQKEAAEALETAAEYFGEKKDRFLAESREQLDSLEERFRKLKEERVEAGEGSERLAELRVAVSEKLARAKEELADLKEAGSAGWREAADEFGNAWQDLQEAYREFVKAYEARRQEQTRQDLVRG